MRKTDEHGHLQINEHNIAYLMEILGEVEKKVDDLFLVYKGIRQTDDPGKVKSSYIAWFCVPDR